MGQPMPIVSPRRLRGGLEDVAGPIGMPAAASQEGWLWGVQYQPVCGLERFRWGCGRFDEIGNKPDNGIEDAVNFDPVTLGVTVNCGPNGPNSPIGDIARFIAEQGLERYYYSDLAQVLADGDVGTGTPNPSLQGDAVLPAGLDLAAPAGIVATIQGLLDQGQNCWDGQVVFHVPYSYLPQLKLYQVVDWDPVRGVWHMGPHDFSFDTYPNLGPAAAELATPTVQDGSEVWIYMTSKPLIGEDALQSIAHRDVRTNEYLVVAERATIVVFDPCCVGGAKARVCG